MTAPKKDQPRTETPPPVISTRPPQPPPAERHVAAPAHEEGQTVEEPGYGHGV